MVGTRAAQVPDYAQRVGESKKAHRPRCSITNGTVGELIRGIPKTPAKHEGSQGLYRRRVFSPWHATDYLYLPCTLDQSALPSRTTVVLLVPVEPKISPTKQVTQHNKIMNTYNRSGSSEYELPLHRCASAMNTLVACRRPEHAQCGRNSSV